LFGAYDFGTGQALYGLNLRETIATLAGAHTIGKTRVTPKSPVNVGLGSLSNDPDKFNGVYYTQVMSVDGYKGM
jgi:catalase (peroxidase I)